MKIKHFDTTQVDPLLAAYKANPNETSLDELYNAIDHIILTVTNKIASGFCKRHPDDFMDLQQNVRISIYRILPKLATISVSGNQVIAVVVKATVWAFKSKYSAYKRKTPVKGSFGDSWVPDNEVPVEVQLEMAIGGDYGRGAVNQRVYDAEDHTNPDSYRSHMDTGVSTKHFFIPKIWINANQYETVYLKNLPTTILNKALSKNRYKNKETLIRFCLVSLIEGRDASTILISKRWGENNPSFWTKYSSVLLKLAILETIL